MPGPVMRKTAIRRPLTPRTTTSWSSPPRTSPKAPRKRSSVWSTVTSSIPVKLYFEHYQTTVDPSSYYQYTGNMQVLFRGFSGLRKTRFIIFLWQDGSRGRAPSKESDCSDFVKPPAHPRGAGGAYWGVPVEHRLLEQSEKPPRSDILPKMAEALGVRVGISSRQ